MFTLGFGLEGPMNVLRMADAQANFMCFQISKPPSFSPGWDLNSQPSDLWADT